MLSIERSALRGLMLAVGSRVAAAVMVTAVAACSSDPAPPPGSATPTTTPAADRGSVIFLHPDGASAATWAVARAWIVGPDGDLEWDRLPHVAVYRGHMADSLTATSNGGATSHAFGVKVASSAFGRTAGGAHGQPIVDADGHSLSVGRQAIRAGIPVGVVQTGISSEPGTACFLVDEVDRYKHEAIAARLLASGATVMLGGGERWFLPTGVDGVHGPGSRTDGRDLVAEARTSGWFVVRTRAELAAVPADAARVLGLFAWDHTFNDRSEEELREAGLPAFEPDAPTVGEMTAAALRVLAHGDRRFLLVVEEEGTDNFGNHNNAAGVLEAAARADVAIGVARAFAAARPDTLVLTCADSDAGGMRMTGIVMSPGATVPLTVHTTAPNGAPVDGAGGTGTAPFMSAPDRTGQSLPFSISWAQRDDVSGGVVVRGEGFRATEIFGSMDNTEVTALMRRVLFGGQRPTN